MSRRIFLYIATIFFGSEAFSQQSLTAAQYREDFDVLWQNVQNQYAYWPEKKTDWQCVRERFGPQLDTMRQKYYFTLFLERVLRELYDQHMGINTNTPVSYRLVPTGADVALRLANGRAFITEVRPRSGAERSGIRAGMELVQLNGKPWQEAIAPILPQCLVARIVPPLCMRFNCWQPATTATHAT